MQIRENVFRKGNDPVPMKKSFTTVMIYLLFPLLSIHAMDTSAVYESLWGTSLDEFKKGLDPDRPYIQFSPAEKPDYKNKILSYITAIDENLSKEIIILRTLTAPETDYLFVKNKLYTIMENWDIVDLKKQNDIMDGLKKKFGEPSLQKDENFYIYSFNSRDSKVLLYVLKLPDDRARCRVYLYTNKLFKMLIMGQ